MNVELRLLSLSDRETKTSGRMCKATFEMHQDDYEALRGKAGSRFGAALVEINDDETSVPEADR